ncbi:MAG: IS66 family transposase [Planctomycetota bacterium]|nr:IS66 family transposase [Planctomycetota bacterium]
MPDTDRLPDDPKLLKEMIVQRDAAIEQIKQEAAQRIAAMEQKHQAEIAAVLRRFYGPRSERFDPRQLLLFGVRVDTMPLDTPSIEEDAGQKLVTRRARHKHGRTHLPEHLPRVPIEHDLSEDEKKCPCCGTTRHRIGQEVSEQLECIPASLKVLRHIRYKYACRQCESNALNPQIETATKTPQPIEKGLPGPGLMAYVITSKRGDHLPLYRLEHIFARQGVEVARSTMSAWEFAAGDLTRPLVQLMGQRVRQSAVVHTDDTRVPIQAPGTGRCRSGRLWAYLGDRDHPYTVYDYTPDRTRAGPSRWLDNFTGYLQADAYGGYDGIYCKGTVIEVACWAHGRRKYFDAKDTDARRAAEMLAMVRELYAVEHQASEQFAALAAAPGKTIPSDQADAVRLALRQEHSAPILQRIKTWLDTEGPLVLPRSPMAAAITYTLNQWDALNVYTTRGFLAIDNNAAERAMKRVAIGRKNWLFAGNDRAAANAAILYSLIASAERHGLDPQAYLTSVLAKIASTPITQLDQFLPDVWLC